MNLYLLKRTARVYWDETRSLVVRAEDETHARALAASAAGDEGIEVWVRGFEVEHQAIGPTKTMPVTCELLTTDGEPGVICRNFRNG